MSIDEAISHAREVAEIQRNNDKLNKTLGKGSPYYNTDCIKCAEEHEQLAEWLEELKAYKSDNFTKNLQTLVYKQGYNKAMEDFVSRLETVSFTKTQWDLIKTIAEQLKAGGKNDD